MTSNTTIGASETALNADFERSAMKHAKHSALDKRFRTGLCRGLFALLLGVSWLLMPATGRTQSSNRWLFVFNTSAAMHSRAQAVQAVAADLLSTAMHGNLRAGDTIGIWTYDTELRSDEAPLQTWDPNSAQTIFQHTLGFLNGHRYAGPAAFDDVIVNMLHVTKISDTITIILVSDGSDPMKGTPFDASINAFYKKNYKTQKQANMPLITVFRGERGKMTTFTDTLAPWPVDIPAVPPSTLAKASPPKAATPSKPAPLVPSLVMIGKKSETVLHPLADYADQTPTPPPPTEQKPTTQTPAPETAPAAKPEEKPTAEAAALLNQPASPAAPKQPDVPPVVQTAKVAESPAAAQPAPPVDSAQKPAMPAQPNPETGVAPAPQNLFSARNIAIVLGAFVVILCGLLWTTQRSRRGSRASLITRSLDREQK